MPEIFQRRMSAVLEGLDGVLCHMDDVFGSSKEEHDLRLSATLQRLEKAGVTLNPSKCVFATDHIKFLGHIVDKTGVQADPAKASTILQMDAPTNLSDL